MASGDQPPGAFGRGGRGLAIFEALKKEQQGRGIGMGRGVLSLGRAGVLQQAAQAAQAAAQQAGGPPPPQPDAAGAPVPAAAPPTQPMGRGKLAGMLAGMQSGGQSPLGGRGRAVLTQTAAISQQKLAMLPQASLAVPHPVAEAAQPLVTGGALALPTAAMGRMGIRDESRKPTVSKRGQGGKPMALVTNYVRLRARNKNIFQYHVDFRPVVDSKAMRCGLLNEHKEQLKVKLFDGTIMYLPNRLENDETLLKSTRRTDGAVIEITVKLTKVLPSEECPQLYNIMLRRIMTILTMCQVGRYYYNPKTPSHVPAHNLEVWPGYITAIKEHEGGLFLLLDSSHRVLRTQTVLEIIEEIANRKQKGFREEITRKIVGCTVLTRYNNKTYRVDDIDWGKSPGNTFDTSRGPVSFQDYYWSQYGKKVTDNQPLLVHRPKAVRIGGKMMQPRTEIICLIPELCYLTGLTDDMRADFMLMKDLSNHTRVSPNQRLMTMKKFVDSVKSTPEALQQLENWGLELDDTALDVEGRQLGMETIIMNGTQFKAGPQADWSRDACRNRVLTAVDVEHWQIYYWRRNAPEVNSFIQEAIKAGAQMGMRVQQPIRIELQDDKTDTLIKALRTNVNPRIQLTVPVMPTSRDDKYSAIKKFCCCECPVPSQVIVHRTIKNDKKLRSVTQKIMLQINCKLGGELWALKIPLERLMVVGIDSFHDVAHGKRSIGGFVASTNSDCTRWFSRVCIQMKAEELLPGLQVAFTAALRKYYEMNHFLPDKIMVFRDGVSDGQLGVVSDYEVRQIEGSFSHFTDYNPKLSVIVVQKRINTRIFLRTNDKGNNLDNPPPGTVLDHTVTKRDMYDYFVVSQHVRQGTVSPTHYIVLHDNIGLPPERMQILTYKMTHLYYNWPGTVRVPAPCLYAHKLAFLVGQSIHKEPDAELSDRLFFL